MFDNVCKFLIETSPTDFATWLLGEPIVLSALSPSELSLEPIRADALILLQSEDVVLHVEFQTKPDAAIPFRMLDYRVRVYRRFPVKTMRQVVVYLRQSRSSLVHQTDFELENTQHRFEVIRLWEQPVESFLAVPGLLPFAVLGRTNNREATLRQVAARLEAMPVGSTQSSLAASTSILSGLVLQGEVIRQILRSETMQESVIYQEIKAEGIQEGIQEGRQKGLQEGLQRERRLVSRLLGRKVGAIPEVEQRQIDRLSAEQLESLGEALLDFDNLEALSSWLQSRDEATRLEA